MNYDAIMRFAGLGNNQPLKTIKLHGKTIQIYPSKRKNKKYDAVVDGKKISYGDKRYQ